MLHSELHGEIKMKSFLVGTAIVKIALNEDIEISECQGKQTGR